jgi:hypothetical protein
MVAGVVVLLADLSTGAVSVVLEYSPSRHLNHAPDTPTRMRLAYVSVIRGQGENGNTPWQLTGGAPKRQLGDGDGDGRPSRGVCVCVIRGEACLTKQPAQVHDGVIPVTVVG